MKKLTAHEKKLVIDEMMSFSHDTIDLSTCKSGDILISSRGTILRYVEQLPEGSYFDHKVEYVTTGGGEGTRTNDGYVFKNNRLETDHNIIKIIHI